MAMKTPSHPSYKLSAQGHDGNHMQPLRSLARTFGLCKSVRIGGPRLFHSVLSNLLYRVSTKFRVASGQLAQAHAEAQRRRTRSGTGGGLL